MSGLILILIEFVVPLSVCTLVLSLTYKHFRRLLLDFTGKEDVAKLFARVFAFTTLLAAVVCPLANQPCGIEQLLNHIGLSLFVLLVTLFANFFVMSKLVSALSRRQNNQK